MRNLNLKKDEQILFFNFLTWACKEAPKNDTEWGEQYELLKAINYNLINYIINGNLKCSKNESWAIQNYFQTYVDEIYDDRLGEQLFNECRDLFVRINDELYESQHNAFIFINSQYEMKPKKTIVVNPLDNPERYLA